MKNWISVVSVVLAVCMLSSCGMAAAREIPVSSEIAEETSFQWTEEEEETFLRGLTEFTSKTASEILVNGEGNRLYSPASLYLAMAMTAECAAGDTEAQILELLGAEDLDAFRDSAAAWQQNLSQENKEGTVAIANSVWLRDDFSYFSEPIDRLGNFYDAQTFEADFKDSQLPNDIGSWIQKATHGLLGKDTTDFQPEADTQLFLFSTLYLKSAWSDPFSKQKNSEAPFYKADGSNDSVAYMNQTVGGSYWEGENFTAGSRSLQNGASMRFILPKEGFSPEELAADSTQLQSALFPEETEYAQITWQVPKFSVQDSLEDIPKNLENLGLTLPFDRYQADFSALSQEPLFLSEIIQKTTLTIDEEGCEGAAYTQVSADNTAAMRPKEVELNLNRPFLFAVVYQDTILFAGIINDPAEN